MDEFYQDIQELENNLNPIEGRAKSPFIVKKYIPSKIISSTGEQLELERLKSIKLEEE